MVKKAFFKERTPVQIARLNTQNAYRQGRLVSRIRGLDDDQGIIVRAQIIPGRFYSGTRTGEEATRKAYKHGDLIKLSQPKTQGAAFESNEIPLAIRARDFSKLQEKREEEINVIGYSWRPVQGRDRRMRKVVFSDAFEGAMRFAYADLFGGVQVKSYSDAKRVAKEGADVVCRVPSKQKKKPRYVIKLKHVPVEGSTERRAVTWSLSAEGGQWDEREESQEPMSGVMNMRYTYEDDKEGSDIFTFTPHQIAACLGVINYHNKEHNWTPFEMSQFAIPSKMAADFYRKLCNNVAVFDPTVVSNKQKLRKLHRAEKSILIARLIGDQGHDATVYWDPGRDGKLRNYDWTVNKQD